MENGNLVFVDVSVVGMLLTIACTLEGTAQTCCPGGILPGGSLGLVLKNSKPCQE